MGITIHYHGRINDHAAVDILAEEVEDLAHELGWDSQRWNEDWAKPNTAAISHKHGIPHITGHLPLRGLHLIPHKNSEPVWLTFTSEGYLVDTMGMVLIAEGEAKPEDVWVGTKTQFAPIETHIIVIKLLKYLKKRYILNLEVHDEGGYWDTGDINELKRRFNTINRSMDILEDALDKMPLINTNHSVKDLADMIEEMLKKKFGR